MDHRVEVVIGAERVPLTRWNEVSITLDILRPGSPWTLTLWRRGEGAQWARVRAAAQIFARVRVTIDGALQLDGVVERVRDFADRQGAPLTLAGRDALAPAIVSDVDPRLSLRGVTLSEAIERALAPLSLPLVIGASAAEVRAIQAGSRPGARGAAASTRTPRRQRVDRFKPEVGQKVLPFVQQLAKRHGFLVFGGPAGDGMGLVVDRPDYSTAPRGSLVRRWVPGGEWRTTGNLLAGGIDLNASEIPTEVTVFGSSRLTAPADVHHVVRRQNAHFSSYIGGAEPLLRVLGVAPGLDVPFTVTEEVRRAPRRVEPFENARLRTATRVAATFTPRPRYLRDRRARSPQIAEQRARSLLAQSMADFATFEGTVAGFSPDGEGPWTMNAMVTVDDEVSGARGNWFVAAVTFRQAREGGQTTTLRCVPPGAIDLEPDPEV